MKKQIKKVQDYFKNKMLSNDFEVENIDEYVISLKIDGYLFSIWIGNLNIEGSINQHFMRYNFLDLKITIEESILLHKIIFPAVKIFRKDNLQKKISEFEKMKNAL